MRVHIFRMKRCMFRADNHMSYNLDNGRNERLLRVIAGWVGVVVNLDRGPLSLPAAKVAAMRAGADELEEARA